MLAWQKDNMRTIISGHVQPDHLGLAELMADIVATSLVTNGATIPRVELGLPVVCYPIDPRLGALGEEARDYTLCLNADALVVVGHNDHLVKIARQYRLPVFEVQA